MCRVVLGMMVALLSTGCATSYPDPAFTCEVLKSTPNRLARASRREVYEMSYGTPARPKARSAYAQQIAIIPLTALGGAALIAGFVQGFVVTDQARYPGVRDAGWGEVGGAAGLGLIALVLGITGPKADREARKILDGWSKTCQGMGTFRDDGRSELTK